MDDDDIQEASINPEETPVSKTATSTANSTTSGDGAAATGASSATADAAAAAAAATSADASKTEAGSEPASAPAADEAAPPKPPRPLTEQQKNEQTLKEAFPAVDAAVIKAVLTASRGNIEAAFHALLEMTDPDAAQHEPAPPPQPPRPVQQTPVHPGPGGGRLSPYSQMVADEEYARQLAQHYEAEDGEYEARTSHGSGYGRSRGGYQRGQNLKPNELWGDKEHSFIDDDLPVIQENLRKGFAETQTKFNSWFTGIKKKINEEWNSGENDDGEYHQGGAGSPSRGQSATSYARYGSRQPQRRSGDYDADPEVLSDDFAGIQLHGDGTPVRHNPNVFRPPPSSTSPRPGSERKVAFRDQDETIDMYSASPKLPPKDGPGNRAASPAAGAGAGGAKASKWQPMSSVDPTPMADNDPFSLGDSEDEKDNNTSSAAAKSATASKGDAATESAGGAKSSTSSTSPEDAERLRKAAAEAMADSLVEDKTK
ncbi:CUE domain containing protein [Sporothrix schenckii 1099-18]|uniref:CUE domain containing protein n=1 Tax=Sporothrix schenckii 1099-18 TaxID=1397361 RepID=A0A0F2MB99_SPOSC|nr:CUE domain containing protein [Sporothrix schenckii 1099-18]KJR86958.1 CUE domain containing protein [Sporothrix schenckii 1099-18]